MLNLSLSLQYHFFSRLISTCSPFPWNYHMISPFSLKGSDNLIVSLLREIFLSWETTHPGTNLIAHLSNFQYPSCQPHLTISLRLRLFSLHIVNISNLLGWLSFWWLFSLCQVFFSPRSPFKIPKLFRENKSISKKQVLKVLLMSIWSFNCEFTLDSVREYGLFQNILTSLSSWISIGSVLLSSRQAAEWHLN